MSLRYKLLKRSKAFTYYQVFVPKKAGNMRYLDEMLIIKAGNEYSLFSGGSRAVKTVRARNISEALRKLFDKYDEVWGKG